MFTGSSSTTTSRDPSYTLLRAALELMLELNDGAERADLALMLVRVYLQLSINHEVRKFLANGVYQKLLWFLRILENDRKILL